MAFIDIPEGTKQIRMKDGEWVDIPEGSRQVDESMLWQENSSSQAQTNNPSIIDKASSMIDKIKTVYNSTGDSIKDSIGFNPLEFKNYKTEQKDAYRDGGTSPYYNKDYKAPTVDLSKTYANLKDIEQNQIDALAVKAQTSIDRLDKAINESSDTDMIQQYTLAKSVVQDNLISDISKIKKQTYNNLELERKTQELAGLSISNRYEAGTQSIIAGAKVNVIAPIAKAIGMDKVADSIMQSGNATKAQTDLVEKKFKDTFGEDKWNIAMGVGERTPELLATLMNPETVLGRMIWQGVVGGAGEYTLTGNATNAGVSALFGSLGSGAIDTLMKSGTKQVMTSFGKKIENLPPEERDKTLRVFQTLEDNGINRMDENGRKQLLSNIDFSKSTEEISKQVNDKMDELSKIRYQDVKNIYALADEEAKQHPVEIPKDLLSDIETQINKDEQLSKANSTINFKNTNPRVDKLEELKKLFSDYVPKEKEAPEYTLYDLQNIRKALYDLKGQDLGSTVYKQAIDKVNELESQYGGDIIYKDAREAHKEYGRLFTGRVEGFGEGSLVKQSIANDERYNVAKSLLTGKIEPNRAESLKLAGLDQSMREDMVKDILTTGMDKVDLNTTDGVTTLVNNWKNADANGLKVMLGNKYDLYKNNFEALGVLNSTLDKYNSEIGRGFKEDIQQLISAGLMSHISGIIATKNAVRAVGDILDRRVFNQAKLNISARLKNIKDPTDRQNAMRALTTISFGGGIDKASEE